jgi:hypothetical protein
MHELARHVAEDPHGPSDAKSVAQSEALLSARSPPQFSDIQSFQGTFTMASFGGNQNAVNISHHITNTNSGNTTTTIVRLTGQRPRR